MWLLCVGPFIWHSSTSRIAFLGVRFDRHIDIIAQLLNFIREISIMRKKNEKISVEFNVEYDEIEWQGAWIPKTVYKYRNWEDKYHQEILTKSSVWVSDSYNFNDPFDCNIPVAYELLVNNNAIAEKFIWQLVTRRGTQINKETDAEVKRRLKEGKHKDPQFIQNYKYETLHSGKKMHGVLSATPINNNILMWSHYGNSHKGFCVGFDSAKLFEYLGGGGPVAYAKDFPIISPIDSREAQYGGQVMTKSNHWGYEVEYRLTTFGKVNMSIPIPKDVISEVIFGARISPEHKKEIIEILKSNLPHVKCFSAIPEKSKFELKIIQE